MDAVEYLNARREFCHEMIHNKMCGTENIKRRDKICCPFWAKSAHKPRCVLADHEMIYIENTVATIEKWAEKKQ